MAKSTASLSELARAGFADLSAAADKLAELVSHSPNFFYSVDLFQAAPNPDQALDFLVKFNQSAPKQAERVFQSELALSRLVMILGASSGLAEFLLRNDQALDVLFEAELSLPNRDKVLAELSFEIAAEKQAGSKAQIRILRAIYRTNLLRIALWDLYQAQPEKEVLLVAKALSDITEATIESALELAKDQAVWPANELPKLSVIGMGKLGARELNYISDVDIIFVAEESSAEFKDSAIQRATWLAKRMISNLTEFNPEPMLWEVDTNLRPEGKSGALVRSLDSHLAYYDRWAESWEFQALIKARTVAGNLELGLRYEAEVSKRVWSSAAREGFVESVQKMRQRVTDNIPKDQLNRQIKLGPGGLRDIEFTVQLLQLVHGQSDAQLHLRDTEAALTALTEQGYVGREAAEEFIRDYRRLRTLEHRVQLAKMQRTHLMPESEAELRVLARSTKLAASAPALLETWERTKLEVRSLHEKLFYRPLLTAVAGLAVDEFQLTSEQASARLSAIGFQDPKGALAHITAMTQGVSRKSVIQRHLLPVIIRWLSEGIDPDYGLLVFRRISDALGDTHWYIRMLRDSSGAANRLAFLLSRSRLIGELLERIPEATAWLEDDNELKPKTLAQLLEETNSITARHDESGSVANALKANRRREILRLAMSWQLGLINNCQLSAAVSNTSTALLGGILTAVSAEHAPELDFAIVGMGRFGGGEQALLTDADLIMVYREKLAKTSSKANIPSQGPDTQLKATKVVTELRALAEDVILPFTTDFSLRPEGNQGALIRSLDSYRQYYDRWVEPWERQALLRATPVAGDTGLLSDFLALIDNQRYNWQPTVTELREIRRIKARVESERLPKGADPARHLKLGRGSLSDVEWLVQVYQLQFASGSAQLRQSSTIGVLQALLEIQKISAKDANTLESAWLLASEVRNALTVFSAKLQDVLPTNHEQLDAIARLLGMKSGSAVALEEKYLATTRRARRVFEKLFY